MTVFNAVLMPVVVMLMFVYMLGDAFSVGVDYVDYATPGLMLLAVCYGLGSVAMSVNSDMTKGIINRFKVMDVSRSAVLNGHVIASVLTNLVAIAALVGVAFLLGFSPSASLLDWLGVVGSSCCSVSRPAGSRSPWDWRRSLRKRRAWPPCRWSCCRSSAARSCRRTRWDRASGSSRSTSPSRRSSKPCAGCSTAHRRHRRRDHRPRLVRRDRSRRVPVGVAPRSRSERDRDQLAPARLRALPQSPR